MIDLGALRRVTDTFALVEHRNLFNEAADEIERLRAALKSIMDNDCARSGCDVYGIARAAIGNQQAQKETSK